MANGTRKARGQGKRCEQQQEAGLRQRGPWAGRGLPGCSALRLACPRDRPPQVRAAPLGLLLAPLLPALPTPSSALAAPAARDSACTPRVFGVPSVRMFGLDFAAHGTEKTGPFPECSSHENIITEDELLS